MGYDTEATKKELESIYGEGNVFTTAELTENFIVHAFLAPLVEVTRKSDNQKGSMLFNHMPRFYYNFIPE